MVIHKLLLGLSLQVVLVCFFGLSSFAGTEADYHADGIVISASPDWKQFSFMKADGKPAGFLIDYWNLWSVKTGVPVRFRMVTWAKSIDLVTGGGADVHSGLSESEYRKQFLLFSPPLYHIDGVLVSNKHNRCDELNKQSVFGVTADTYALEYVRDLYPENIIVEYEKSEAMLQALAQDEVDYGVIDILSYQDNSNLTQEHRLQICSTEYHLDIRAGVRKDRPELLQLVNKGFSLITPQERADILNCWFIDETGKTQWRLAAVIAVIGVFFISVLVWVWATRIRPGKK